MVYACAYTDEFRKDLQTLSKERQDAVQKKIDQIASMPQHFRFMTYEHGVQKARIGKYRLFFRVREGVIEFLNVRKRDVAYKN